MTQPLGATTLCKYPIDWGHQKQFGLLNPCRAPPYSIQRPPTHDEVMLHLRTELLNRSLFEQLSAGKQELLRQTDQILRTLRDDPQAYHSCFSNYHHYYRYCAFRYFEDDTLTKAASQDEHLLKHTEPIKGQVHDRLNIIFIDTYYITRPVPNDNKFVDRELDTFPTQLRQGITTLYFRQTAPLHKLPH